MELPLQKRQKRIKLQEFKKKSVILLHTQAKRSIKLNGYPRNRPQCTWEFKIQRKSKEKIWDYSVKLE